MELCVSQEPWTEKDSAAVLEVMQALPQLMFKADAVIHVNSSVTKLVMGEGEKFSTTLKDLTPHNVLRADEGEGVALTFALCQELQKNCRLRQVGNVVQVYEEFGLLDNSFNGNNSPYSISSPGVAELFPERARQPRCFDQVYTISNRRVKSLDDLPDERSNSHCSACWSRVFPVHMEQKDQVVEMLKQPFGYRIEVEPTHQGRTYFDRFISIVKVALMEENAAHEVIFANNADVKNDILKGGARLRKATQMGPDVLAAELKFFTEQLETTLSLKLLPVCVKGGRWKGEFFLLELPHDSVFDRQDLVSSLMQVFLEELNIGVSLSLWRALREERLADCRRLLQEKADPNIVDGKGKTCLHHASQARSTAAVQLLLEFGASTSARDHRGCTPAHIVPLFADDTTVELVEIFSKDPAALFEADALRQARREIMDKNEAQFQALPVVEELGIQSLSSSYPEAFETQVRVEARRLHFNGSLRTIFVIHPNNVTHDPVLYLGFNWLLPWSLQEPAMRIMAHRLNRRIFCITAEAVSPELLQAGDDLDSTGHAFYTDLYTMIDTLPLPYKLILMDNTFGLGVPLLWKLQSRLKHILAVNTSWVFRLGFVHSTTHKVLANRATSLKTLAEQRDIKGMVKACGDFILAPSLLKAQVPANAQWRMLGVLVGVLIIRGLLGPRMSYGVLSVLAVKFVLLRMSSATVNWNFNQLTQRLSHMQPWRPEHSIDIVLAYGSHTPTLAVQDSTFNLQEMLPGSLTAVIAQSSWLWQLEGITAVQEVTRLMDLICRSGLGTESLNAMLVSHGPLSPARTSPSKSPVAKDKIKKPQLLRQQSTLKSEDVEKAMSGSVGKMWQTLARSARRWGPSTGSIRAIVQRPDLGEETFENFCKDEDIPLQLRYTALPPVEDGCPAHRINIYQLTSADLQRVGAKSGKEQFGSKGSKAASGTAAGPGGSQKEGKGTPGPFCWERFEMTRLP
eukprot:s744_g38.t1